MSSTSSPSNSSGDDQGEENQLGKQIVELITRLINEAKPEDEKIVVEFTFTPMKTKTSGVEG